MIYLAFLFPAVISVKIWLKRKGKDKKNPLVLEYMGWVLLNVFLSISTIVFVLGLSSADSSAFESFSFFIKYLVIAIIYAVILPFILEIISKWIGVEIIIESDEE